MAASALPMASLAVFLAVVAAAALDMTRGPFDAGYAPLFGDDNLVRSPDGRSVTLKLDRYTGSGFVSKAAYRHGFFSASIKLPGDYTAGVVVAFYVKESNREAVNWGAKLFVRLSSEIFQATKGWRPTVSRLEG